MPVLTRLACILLVGTLLLTGIMYIPTVAAVNATVLAGIGAGLLAGVLLLSVSNEDAPRWLVLGTTAGMLVLHTGTWIEDLTGLAAATLTVGTLALAGRVPSIRFFFRSLG